MSIKLNVGGKIFETTESTLCQSPYFEVILHGNFNDRNKEIIFIDRDPGIFKHVLRLLRNPSYDYPNKFVSELEYFLIDYEKPESKRVIIKNHAPSIIKDSLPISNQLLPIMTNDLNKRFKLFNLKNTCGGNSILNQVRNGELRYEIPRIYDSIKKIKIYYENVKCKIDATYKIVYNNNIILQYDSLYCESIDLLNDDLLNESNYDKDTKNICHEIMFYMEEFPLPAYGSIKFEIETNKECFGDVYVNLYGNFYDNKTREKLLDYHTNMYEIQRVNFYFIPNNCTRLNIENNHKYIKSMILILLDVNGTRYSINNIEIYNCNRLIKTMDNNELLKLLHQNNLNADNNIYLIDFGNPIIFHEHSYIIINGLDSNIKYNSVAYLHTLNMAIFDNGSIIKRFVY